MARRLYALLLVLFILAPTTNIVVKAAGTGYLAIKDYLGKTWTMDDIQKIMNYYYTTSDGENKSLADYFWIVVDDNPDNKYNLRDFIASPIDNKTAVLPLTAGDHTIDIYWFGYHQRVLVNIVENQHYVLNLETAPVVPFKTAGEPPSSAEWDLVYSPDGLKIQRRDGNAYVLFKYNTSYIEVAWYDDDTGWNYQALDVYIDTIYQYKFHVKDPANPEYYEEGTGSFLWLSWDVYKVKEEVKWNRTGNILHVVYTVAIAENEAMLRSINEFWSGVGKIITGQLLSMGYIDSIIGQFISLKGAIEFVQASYDNYMGEFYASKYQKTVLLVWDVFVTPTQIVVLAHAYDVDASGNLVKKPITSANAFTINNRLVYIKQLAGGLEYRLFNNAEIGPLYFKVAAGTFTVKITSGPSVDIGGEIGYTNSNPHIQYPGGQYFNYYVDDLSKYNYIYWFKWSDKVVKSAGTYNYIKASYQLNINITFYDTDKASIFETALKLNNIPYIRDGNTFTFSSNPVVYSISTTYTEHYIIFDITSIEKYIPQNSSGKINFYVSGNVTISTSDTYDVEEVYYYVTKIEILYMIIPKLEPPQISLLKDGYYTVNGAFAAQVFTDLFKDDLDVYMLGYYLLNNEPPPSFIIRDVYYDVDNDVMHYVFTVISADAYGQDIVDMTSNTTLNDNNETIHNYYLNIKPTVRTYDNVTFALFNYDKMSFLNLAPEIIEYLLAVPPNQGGYGTPVIDWSTASLLTINTTRPYELYYYDKSSGSWVRVKTEYINDTMTWNILRYADNVQIESLPPGNMSKYYYKLVYTDTNETIKGWLFNNNGVLKIITGEVTWSISPEELQLLLQQIQLQGIYDKWLEQWNQVAQMLGLIQEQLNNIAGSIIGAWDWINRNKWLLLGGFLLFIILIVMLASATRPRVYVGVGRR